MKKFSKSTDSQGIVHLHNPITHTTTSWEQSKDNKFEKLKNEDKMIKGTISNHETIKKKVMELEVGQGKYWIRQDYSDSGSGGTNLYYERVNEENHKELLQKNTFEINHHPNKLRVSIPKYGNICPRCGKKMMVYYVRTTSDGHWGIEDDKLICEDSKCAVHRVCKFGGYGNI